MPKNRKIILSDEEREMEESISADEWESVGETSKKIYETAAKNTLEDKKKEARVNIRMTAYELALVKSEAEKEGIPYQTLMSSILHKYLTGQFVERKVVDEIKSALKRSG